MNTIVVTRHQALIKYLQEKGLISEDATILSHVTAEDVRGKRVIGVLPLNLAAEAREVIVIPLHTPPELRGVELSLEQVRQYAGEPEIYRVQKTG